MSIVHGVKQGTDAWFAVRRGLATASDFDKILTDELKPRTGQMPQSYCYLKAAEIVTGYIAEQGGSWATEQGSLLESEAIPFLELMWERKIERPGFITDDAMRLGCSPDGMLGADEGLEIKCPQAPAHIQYLMEGGLPKCYAPQVHGSLYVTGFKAWTFVSYSRKLPPLIVRVERDEAIMATIGAALATWIGKLDAVLGRLDPVYAKSLADKTAKCSQP